MSNSTAKRFRIALSFAGEKRAYVEQVARILADRFTEAAILYDKFHEAEFARRDLGIHLPELYHKQTDLVVVIICQDYETKEWCGLEWVAIHALLKNRKDEDVMLSNFDHATVKGIYDTSGFIELDHKTPAQTAVLILERLALNEGRPRDYYTKPADNQAARTHTSIPNNLPRLQPFFGREKELEAIREALDPASRTWGVLIDGPGGMGKTSLAIRAAYDSPPGLFRRIIFLSVKDRELEDDGVRSLRGFIVRGLLEMFNELARELKQPEIAKAPEEERARLLLDVLRDANALLVLDNLESLNKGDREGLFTFVKRLPQGCKAILTSRRRIGSSADTLILEKLDEASALETLAELALHNPLLARATEAERVALHEQTGGNPLLLRWTAGQLGRGSCRSVAEAREFLRSCPPDNDPLEFIFGDLANEFTPEETRVLVALTYFSQPASVKHIRTLTSPLSESEKDWVDVYDGVSDEDAEEAGASPAGTEPPQALTEAEVETALHTLANRSLVVPDQEERHHALVPMVADFLRKYRPDVVAETGDRLWKRAYALIVENGFDEHDRFPTLDAAWPIVVPALPLFLAGPNERLQTVCDALGGFLNFTGRWDERLSLEQHAEARAVAAGDFENAGWRAYKVGSIHCLRRQSDEVPAWVDRAAAHWDKGGCGARERAAVHHLRGVGHALKEDYPSACAAYREALTLARSLSTESAEVAIYLSDLASVERHSGDLDVAERNLREALRIVRAVDDHEGVAACTGNLAALMLNREDWPGAETLAREALALAEKVGRQEFIAASCRDLSKALVRQGKAVDALPHAQRAVEIYTKLGSPNLEWALEVLRECRDAIASDECGENEE